MELFPPHQPWKHFPWEGQFGPRSRCEDELRQAVGLRELSTLQPLLAAAAHQGLSKRNSRIYFEALELRDLLQAEASAASQLAARTAAAAVPPAAAWCRPSLVRDSGVRRRRSALRRRPLLSSVRVQTVRDRSVSTGKFV